MSCGSDSDAGGDDLSVWNVGGGGAAVKATANMTIRLLSSPPLPVPFWSLAFDRRRPACYVSRLILTCQFQTREDLPA